VLMAAAGPIVVAAFALVKEGHRAALLLLVIPALALTVAIAARLFLLAVLRLEFEKRWYVVTDRSLRIREGVITVREMTVNFANIQNISISQGPIQRALGIADLRVETAGGGGGASRQEQSAIENLHTARFRGINNASEVRQLIQDRLRHLKDSGLGDREELSIPASAPHPSAFVSALREVHAEAVALRQWLTRAWNGDRE